MTLVSPLQSAPCVWYRAEVRSLDEDGGGFTEERSVGFRVRDGSGSIRVFPRWARFDAPAAFQGDTDVFGVEPPGLALRQGPAFASPPTEDREAAIAALLTVRRPGSDRGLGSLGLGGSGGGSNRRHYEEARLSPGDVVTVVGAAMPFSTLEDPHGADLLDRFDDPLVGLRDPEVAASIAEARAAGTLLGPEEAWGNAAIPGFGIGRPVRPPELDAGVHPPVLATPAEAARIERTFDLAPDVLVVAAAPMTPLIVAAGTPEAAVARAQGRFLVGLLGAALAIASAVVLALAVTGTLG